MKAGDLVRFVDLSEWGYGRQKLGLLIKYEKWEKIGTVLHGGQLLRIRAGHITKAGRQDSCKLN